MEVESATDDRAELWQAYLAAMAAADTAYAEVVRLTAGCRREESEARHLAWERWKAAALREKQALAAVEGVPCPG